MVGMVALIHAVLSVVLDNTTAALQSRRQNACARSDMRLPQPGGWRFRYFFLHAPGG